MKKICPNCKHINDYKLTVCEKCGCDLDKSEVYKVCPECGKHYSLNIEECPVCRQTLIVSGTSAATVFDETSVKDGIPLWIWIVGVFVPLIGVIISWIYSFLKKESIPHESAVNLRLVCLLGQVVWITALVVLIKIVIGNIIL